mgnify:CR=1 FL=1
MKRYQYDEQEFALMENSCIPLAIYQFLDNRVVTLVLSAGFLELFDFTDREEAYRIMDNDMYRDCHPDDTAVIEDAAVRFATKDEPYNVLYRTKVKGKYIIVHAQGKHIYKGDTRLATVWYTDEGEYRQDGERDGDLVRTVYSNLFRGSDIEHIIKYDFLTGLPTLSHFFYLADTSYFNKSIENGEVPVMLFFDLNGMKYFNAKYGFGEGDRLIRAFARLLIETFSNDCCCRVGMDRFCVYTNDSDLEDRLWKLFDDSENINGGKSLPVRVGIYSGKMEICGASFACDRAKIACDSNKSFYLSHFTYFDKSMLQEAWNRQYIIDNIDRAIEEGWIQVYYQPIIRAANGRVCDEEALSRWIDPERGMLNPADFIPILEDANLIYKLDLYVTDQILKKMKTQADAGLYIVPISVNLSRSDFTSCDVVGEIQRRMVEAGIPPEKLTIEITESMIGSDYDYMKAQVKRFQSSGFKVWMDDFGSGYSSLNVLHDIPFNLIKFDMKFMQQFYENAKSKIILSNLVRMAMGLGIETLCEGVESEQQVAFLKEVGCTKLQGHFYCRAIPLKEILDRYETGRQIGFENPAESDYYASLGKINLYDLSIVTNADDEMFKNVFSTLPMSVLEADETQLRIIRGNKSFREFFRKYFSEWQGETSVAFDRIKEGRGALFMEAVRICQNSRSPRIVEEELADGIKVHVYVRRVAVNPVTKVTALVAVILGMTGL